MMSGPLKQQLSKRLESLKAERASFMPHWQELNDYILPRSGRFFVTDRNKGDKRNQKINNSTATYAASVFAAGMKGGLTSSSRPWFALRTPDPDLNKYKPVKVWLDTVRTRMFEVFLSSNIYTTLSQTYLNHGVFGTDAFSILEDDEDVIRCYPYPVGSYCLGASYRGSVDTCYREFQMTAAQMVEQFGAENCSNAAQRASGEARDQWFNVVHAVEPNPEWDPRRLESSKKRFRSVFYEPGGETDTVLRESGYDRFPVLASRWNLTGEDIYGSSQGMVALPDVKMLQLLEKKKVQAIEKHVNPPMNAPSALKNGNLSTLPGGVNFVDITTGQQGFTPAYQIDLKLGEVRTEIQAVEARIRQALYVDMFLMMSQDGRSDITAAEVYARKEEKLQILGPALDRLNDELFDPLIDFVFSVMGKKQMLPIPPPEIQNVPLNVEYISIIAQAIKLAGMSGIQQMSSYTGSLYAVFPEVKDKFNADAAMDEMAGALAVPPLLVRDNKEAGAIRAAREQRQAMQQNLDMAQQGAQTAQTLADTRIDEPSALTSLQAYLQGA